MMAGSSEAPALTVAVTPTKKTPVTSIQRMP